MVDNKSQFSFEGAVEDGREQGVQFSVGLGLQVFHVVRNEVFEDGNFIVRPGMKNTPSP